MYNLNKIYSVISFETNLIKVLSIEVNNEEKNVIYYQESRYTKDNLSAVLREMIVAHDNFMVLKSTKYIINVAYSTNLSEENYIWSCLKALNIEILEKTTNGLGYAINNVNEVLELTLNGAFIYKYENQKKVETIKVSGCLDIILNELNNDLKIKVGLGFLNNLLSLEEKYNSFSVKTVFDQEYYGIYELSIADVKKTFYTKLAKYLENLMSTYHLSQNTKFALNDDNFFINNVLEENILSKEKPFGLENSCVNNLISIVENVGFNQKVSGNIVYSVEPYINTNISDKHSSNKLLLKFGIISTSLAASLGDK